MITDTLLRRLLGLDEGARRRNREEWMDGKINLETELAEFAAGLDTRQ
jgi:hypothetical protein